MTPINDLNNVDFTQYFAGNTDLARDFTNLYAKIIKTVGAGAGGAGGSSTITPLLYLWAMQGVNLINVSGAVGSGSATRSHAA